MEARNYLNELKTRLATSTAIAVIEGVTELEIGDRGYFRGRLSLSNGDFREVSEYFIIRGGKPETVEYRYQWMDNSKQRLIRRWDNARHFSELPNFAHHVHVGHEKQVVPGQAMSILNLIDLIEQQLDVQQT
jgi:hypothetical protein